MPDEEKKNEPMVDIDTSGPEVEVNLEEETKQEEPKETIKVEETEPKQEIEVKEEIFYGSFERAQIKVCFENDCEFTPGVTHVPVSGKLIGKEENLVPLLDSILGFKSQGYRGDTSILRVEISNNSSSDMTLKVEINACLNFSLKLSSLFI